MILNPEDVAYAWAGYSGHLPKETRRLPARLLVPTVVTLTHRPSGVSVSGEVARRDYSRREMQDQLSRLRKKLLAELERRVGKGNRGQSPNSMRA